MPNPYPCPTSPTEAVADARARVRSVSCLLDILHPAPGRETPLVAWPDRDEAWREVLLALTRCIAHVEHARDLEWSGRQDTDRRLVWTTPGALDDAPELGAVS